MTSPSIYESVFAFEGDEATNSEVLRAAFGAMKVAHNIKTNGFSSVYGPWRLRIEDCHEDEKDPHYVLDVGERREELGQNPDAQDIIYYCDFRSDHEKSAIYPDPGHYIVSVWLNKESRLKYPSLTTLLKGAANSTYLSTTRKEFPGYAVWTS